MELRTLGNTNLKLSSLGFGASSLGGVFHSLKEEDGIRAVHTAVENGINFIDVSPYYGHLKAEMVLGKALKEIPRDKFILSSTSSTSTTSNFRRHCPADCKKSATKPSPHSWNSVKKVLLVTWASPTSNSKI